MRARRLAVPLTAAALALTGTLYGPATHAAVDDEVVGGLVTPLSVAIDDDSTVYVSQSFAGLLTRKAPGGEPTVIHDADGAEVGAVSVDGGVVTFATTAEGKMPQGKLWRLDGEDLTMLLNTTRYEKTRNPDRRTTYGMVGVSRKCMKKLPRQMRKRKGIVESHPYATALGPGVTYLADAAMNAILSVTDDGKARTVATLPATRVKVTRKLRKQYELPRCTRTGTFKSESVPTDVEIGPDGNLYVTSLPGAPEGLPNGRVYRIVPGTGAVTRVQGGLTSPVGLAITPDGTAYVSSLFGGVVMEKHPGAEPTVFAEVPFPGDVEFHDGEVYVTRTDLTNESGPPNGAVLKVSNPR